MLVPWGWSRGSQGTPGEQPTPASPTLVGLRQTWVHRRGCVSPSRAGDRDHRPAPSPGANTEDSSPGTVHDGTVTHLSPETASPGSRGLLAGHGRTPLAARRGGPPRRRQGLPSPCTTAGWSPQPQAEAPGARARGAGAAGRTATQHRPEPGGCVDAGRGRTYHGLQELQVGQGLAQESHTGRPGGQECIHCHRGTRGPTQQACRSNQKQLPVRGRVSIVISGLGASRQALGHHPTSETRTGDSTQVARSG